MIIIPREKPIVQGLNSYYLDIDKLLEHYQGELGAGMVYFRSPVAEAVVFFDEQNLVNGFFEDRRGRIEGPEAIDRIREKAVQNNFTVSVFRILPERLYFWANLPNSKSIYKDLTSEFTDLEGLIRKMEAEKLTGFIDVELSQGDGGLLFMYEGRVIGGSSADGTGSVDRSQEYRDDLIRRSKEHGGKFTVNQVFLQAKALDVSSDEKKPESTDTAGAGKKSGRKPGRHSSKTDEAGRERTLEMLRVLLATLESLVRGSRRIRLGFESLLNKKFVEKLDKYEFLDPFAADFKYVGGRIRYTGDARMSELVAGIEECVYEIAEANGLLDQLRRQLDSWRTEFADEIERFDMRL